MIFLSIHHHQYIFTNRYPLSYAYNQLQHIKYLLYNDLYTFKLEINQVIVSGCTLASPLFVEFLPPMTQSVLLTYASTNLRKLGVCDPSHTPRCDALGVCDQSHTLFSWAYAIYVCDRIAYATKLVLAYASLPHQPTHPTIDLEQCLRIVRRTDQYHMNIFGN